MLKKNIQIVPNADIVEQYGGNTRSYSLISPFKFSKREKIEAYRVQSSELVFLKLYDTIDEVWSIPFRLDCLSSMVKFTFFIFIKFGVRISTIQFETFDFEIAQTKSIPMDGFQSKTFKFSSKICNGMSSNFQKTTHAHDFNLFGCF